MPNPTPGLLIVLLVLFWSISLENLPSAGVQASLPEVPSVEPHEKFAVPVEYKGNVQSPLKNQFNRLPGVCRRLRRRRITILCNMEKYCSVKQRWKPGQVCRCPRGSRCSHFFLKSL